MFLRETSHGKYFVISRIDKQVYSQFFQNFYKEMDKFLYKNKNKEVQFDITSIVFKNNI